jgi:hypothetical protein
MDTATMTLHLGPDATAAAERGFDHVLAALGVPAATLRTAILLRCAPPG